MNHAKLDKSVKQAAIMRYGKVGMMDALRKIDQGGLKALSRRWEFTQYVRDLYLGLDPTAPIPERIKQIEALGLGFSKR